MAWADVLADVSLHDLPCKIELNAQGQIVMNPASKRHGIVQARLAVELAARAEGIAWAEAAFGSPTSGGVSPGERRTSRLCRRF